MKNNLGILQIELSDEMFDENGEISLETAIENKWDAIVELIKNPSTSKLVYIHDGESSIQGFPIRMNRSFELIADLSLSGTSVGSYSILTFIVDEEYTKITRYFVEF